MKEGSFRKYKRNKFFEMRMLRHLNREPREVVYALSLEVFRLDRALSNLFYWKVSLCIAGCWTR